MGDKQMRRSTSSIKSTLFPFHNGALSMISAKSRGQIVALDTEDIRYNETAETESTYST